MYYECMHIYIYVQSGTMQCMCFTNSPLCIVFHNNNNTERLSVGGDGLKVNLVCDYSSHRLILDLVLVDFIVQG